MNSEPVMFNRRSLETIARFLRSLPTGTSPKGLRCGRSGVDVKAFIGDVCPPENGVTNPVHWEMFGARHRAEFTGQTFGIFPKNCSVQTLAAAPDLAIDLRLAYVPRGWDLLRTIIPSLSGKRTVGLRFSFHYAELKQASFYLASGREAVFDSDQGSLLDATLRYAANFMQENWDFEILPE